METNEQRKQKMFNQSEHKIYTNIVATKNPMRLTATADLFEFFENYKPQHISNYSKNGIALNGSDEADRTYIKQNFNKGVIIGEFGDSTRRNNKNLLNRSALILDLDDLADEYKQKRKIQSYMSEQLQLSYIMYETISHGTKIDGELQARYRIIIPMSHALTKDEYAFTIGQLNRKLVSDGVLLSVDGSQETWSQLQHLPFETGLNNIEIEMNKDLPLFDSSRAIGQSPEKERKSRSNVVGLDGKKVERKHLPFWEVYNIDRDEFDAEKFKEIGVQYRNTVEKEGFKNGNDLTTYTGFLKAAIEVQYAELVNEINHDEAIALLEGIAYSKEQADENKYRYESGQFLEKAKNEPQTGITHFLKTIGYRAKTDAEVELLEKIENEKNSDDGRKAAEERERAGLISRNEFFYKATEVGATAKYEKGQQSNSGPQKLSTEEVQQIALKNFDFEILQEDNNSGFAPLYMYLGYEGIYTREPELIETILYCIEPELSPDSWGVIISKIRKVLTREGFAKETRKKRYVPIANGVLDLANADEPKLIPYHSKLKFTNKLPRNYRQGMKHPEFKGAEDWSIHETISELMSHDKGKIKILLQSIGDGIHPAYSRKKGFHFLGTSAGNNGKGTVQELIAALVGNHNVATIKVDEFEDRFRTAELVGKIVVIGDDVNPRAKIEDSSIFKSLITGDRIYVEIKGKQGWSQSFVIGVFQSSNAMFTSSDKTLAFADRIIIITFKEEFSRGSGSEEDKTKRENNRRIKDEFFKDDELLDYFFSYLVDEGYFTFKEFDVPEDSLEAHQEWTEGNDPVRKFMTEIFYRIDIKNLPVKYLFELFRVYCESKNIKSDWYSEDGFAERLKNSLPQGHYEVKTAKISKREAVEENLPPIEHDEYNVFYHGETSYDAPQGEPRLPRPTNDNYNYTYKSIVRTKWGEEHHKKRMDQFKEEYASFNGDSLDDDDTAKTSDKEDIEQTSLSDEWNYNYDFSKDKDNETSEKPEKPEKPERKAYGKNLMDAYLNE